MSWTEFQDDALQKKIEKLLQCRSQTKTIQMMVVRENRVNQNYHLTNQLNKQITIWKIELFS